MQLLLILPKPAALVWVDGDRGSGRGQGERRRPAGKVQ